MNVFSAYANRFWLVWLVLFADFALAEEKKAVVLDPMANSGKVLVYLLLVLALIGALAWLIRRSKTFTGRFESSGQNLKIVTSLALGLKEKIAVVQVGEKQLLLGITAQHISLLTELDVPLNQEQVQADNFQSLLKKALGS
ncbi:MAG: flagellar biosynthetic protein FliO [Venatoribacter sp.]